MKTMWAVLGAISVLASSAFAFEIHSVSQFTVNWNDPKSLTQTDGLGCPGEDNTVLITVPGVQGKDFKVTLGPSDSCELVSSIHGAATTVLIFHGQCASDNDENFTIERAHGPRQSAHITVDAGC